jgi:single-strand DNA-binding protein
VLNRIILIGRLTRDPELRYVPSGQPVASFTLAVDRSFVNQQGERATDFIDIVAWRRLAEQVTQHLNKGRLVAVEGRLQIRSYETQDGQKRKVAEVVADAVRFLDRKPGAPTAAVEGSGTEAEPESGDGADDVPF